VIKLLTTPVAVAAAAVDDEDSVQCRWTMIMSFIGGSSVRWQWRWGLRIGDDKVTMEIDVSSGGWRRRVSAFDGGDGQRLALGFDCGDGRQLWQRWTIETVFNGWCLMVAAAFDSV